MAESIIDSFNKELQDEKFAELVAEKVIEKLTEKGIINGN
jgi:hypothetical protein